MRQVQESLPFPDEVVVCMRAATCDGAMPWREFHKTAPGTRMRRCNHIQTGV